MKVKKIFEPIYNTRLTLIYNCKAKEANEYLIKHHMSKDPGLHKCSGQTGWYKIEKYQYEQVRYYIYIEKGKEKETLVHELAHLVFVSLADCGIYVDRNSDEIYAYYLEWWHKRIVKILKI